MEPNSTEADLERAKQLILAKRYADAQALLVTIDHPKADQWLARLSTMTPTPPVALVAPPAPKRYEPNPAKLAQQAKLKRVERAGWVVWAVVIAVALGILAAAAFYFNQSSQRGQVQAKMFSFCIGEVFRSGITLSDADMTTLCSNWQAEAFRTNEPAIMACASRSGDAFGNCLEAGFVEPPI